MDDLRFDRLGDALPLFRIAACPGKDGADFRAEANACLDEIATKPPGNYQRWRDLPRLVPESMQWLVLLHGPEYTAPAWREYMRAEINLWALDQAHLLAHAQHDYEYANRVWAAIQAERTIQRVFCELELAREAV